MGKASQKRRERAATAAHFGAINARKKRKMALLAKNPFCRWCRKAVTYGTATLEHIKPVSHGGTDAPSNTTLACASCNKERGSDVRWSKRNGHAP